MRRRPTAERGTSTIMIKFFSGSVSLGLALLAIALALCAGGVAGTLMARDTTVYDYTLAVAGATSSLAALQYGVWPELGNTNFFTRVRDGFIADRANFVEVNLTAMRLSVYRAGAPVLTVPIKSKGKEGSWWETPSGLYRAQGKEEKHFSSFGHVYMPWSIPFQGNFFIHGWPYYPDGTPVPEGYSGGCIRLEDQYAKQVYDLVDVGMPILVFEENSPKQAFTYALAPPTVGAASYLAADLDNNFVLLAGGNDTSHETPLLAKMMTALVASEYQNIEKPILVQASMLDGLTPERLAVGSSYSLYDLFFPLLLEDSTEAARVLGGYFGEKRFVSLMGAKAAALGMQQTAFTDPAGERPGNTTTAQDVFLFLKYLHTNRPFILSMSAGTTDTRTYGAPLFTDVRSVHPFRDTAGFMGGAAEQGGVVYADTGTADTAAVALFFASTTAPVYGQTDDLITVLALPFGGETRQVAFIALDSRDPAQDTRNMVAYVRQMFH